MDWVVSQQMISKRLLEKHLTELETTQRKAEERRLRQIRDVGVDLTRLQKSTRDLDDILGELNPHKETRRGSLPCTDSKGGFSSFFEPSPPPRSKRRGSCIAALPSHQLSEAAERLLSKNSKSGIMTQDRDKPPNTKMERRGSNPNTGSSTEHTKTSGKTNGSNSNDSKTSRLTRRRGSREDNESSGPQRPPRKSDTEAKSHNVTAVYVHQDENSAKGDDLSEADSHSMFVSARNRSRRATEPALGGYYIRGLQESAVDEFPAFLQQATIENEELKKSIKENLPSDMVAEKDEEEPDEEKGAGRREGATEVKKPSASGQADKLASISETDQDSEEQTKDASAQAKNKNRKGSKDGRVNVKEGAAAEKSNFAALSQRRKSDGDVLKFNKVWKLRQAGRVQSSKAKDSGAKYRHEDDEGEEVEEDDEIWNAVRKCRYIRGYEPPEMTEPTDLSEFVFGHRDPKSLPPEQ